MVILTDPNCDLTTDERFPPGTLLGVLGVLEVRNRSCSAMMGSPPATFYFIRIRFNVTIRPAEGGEFESGETDVIGPDS